MKAALLSWLRAHGGRRAWALSLAAVVLAVLLGTLRQAGLTDDDDFYAPAGISYARWVGRAATLQDGVFTRADIDRAFTPNREHPPMAKYVMGASWWLLSDRLGLLGTLDGARAGVCFLAALLAYVVASLGFMLRGRAGAVTSVLVLFLLPRFFFHARVATLDVPVASLTTVAGYLAWRSRSSLPHAWGAAVAFGAALLTKLNAPFLLVALFFHWLLRAWRGSRMAEGRWAIPAIPLCVPLMVVVGPVMFVGLWPHLWFDTLNRLGAYLAFHLNHYPIYLYYLGDLYTQTIPPWHVPWVMFVSVVPVTALALMVVGICMAAAALWREATASSAGEHVNTDDNLDSLRAFLLIQAFIAIGVVSFLGTPKYGGEKLFMPLFPLVAVLAADGAARVVEGLRGWGLPARVAAAVPLVVVGLHGAWSVGSTWHFPLSYYGEAILGLRGADAVGMEVTYYDMADKQLVTWLNANAPQGARVHFEPNHKEYVRTWNWLRRDGYLRQDIQASEENAAQYVVLTHERRWNTYPALAARYRDWPVVHDVRLDGVRVYTVYRKP